MCGGDGPISFFRTTFQHRLFLVAVIKTNLGETCPLMLPSDTSQPPQAAAVAAPSLSSSLLGNVSLRTDSSNGRLSLDAAAAGGADWVALVRCCTTSTGGPCGPDGQLGPTRQLGAEGSSCKRLQGEQSLGSCGRVDCDRVARLAQQGTGRDEADAAALQLFVHRQCRRPVTYVTSLSDLLLLAGRGGTGDVTTEMRARGY